MIAGLMTLVFAVLSVMWVNYVILPHSESWAVAGFLLIVAGVGPVWYVISEWIE